MRTVPPPSIKQRMRHGFQAAAAHSRLCTPAKAGNAASILMYHSVADGPVRRFVDPAGRLSPEIFDRHCAWLARNRNVVSLTALVETLRSGGRPEPGSVVVTFDDGYLDNLQVAAPILARHALPATLYLATDYVERAAPQWIDRLYTAFRMRRRKTLELRGKSFDLCKRREELDAYRSLSSHLMACDLPSREERLDEIESRLGAAVRLPRLTLDWDDVRTLTKKYPSWEVAAHGAAHLDLSAHSDEVVCDDLARCINTIDGRLGHAPRHFSFPYGRSSEAARQLVVEMGIQSAVAAMPDPLVRKGVDLFGMGRVDAGQSISQLAFWTAGGWQGLRARREHAA